MRDNIPVFEQYEKMSDDLIYLGTNVVLRFTTVFAKHSEKYGRSSFHKEFEYMSNNTPLVTVRRAFDYFLSLENIKMINNTKEFIRIGVENIYLFKDNLNLAYQWFVNPAFNGLFGTKNGVLVITKEVEPIIITGLPLGKQLMIIPTICKRIDRECTGVRLYLNSESNFVDITLDKFMGLIYICDTINMYQSAMLMLNYIQCPPYGYNRTSYANVDEETIAQKSNSTIKKTRKIVPKNTSFISKMEELENE